MIPQLVGMACVRCSGQINSEIDGRFCDVCGNPIHDRCSAVPPGPASYDDITDVGEAAECPRCKADPKTAIACAVREHRLQSLLAASPRPLQQAAEKLKGRKSATSVVGKLSFGAMAAGLILFLVADTDRAAAEYGRFLGWFFLIGGGVLLVASILLSRSTPHAERDLRRISWDEEEEKEPPE